MDPKLKELKGKRIKYVDMSKDELLKIFNTHYKNNYEKLAKESGIKYNNFIFSRVFIDELKKGKSLPEVLERLDRMVGVLKSNSNFSERLPKFKVGEWVYDTGGDRPYNKVKILKVMPIKSSDGTVSKYMYLCQDGSRTPALHEDELDNRTFVDFSERLMKCFNIIKKELLTGFYAIKAYRNGPWKVKCIHGKTISDIEKEIRYEVHYYDMDSDERLEFYKRLDTVIIHVDKLDEEIKKRESNLNKDL